MMTTNPELDCQWHFARQSGGRDVGPNDAMSENFKKFPYASLIRESIQNSLDAVDDDSIPVRMSFQIKKITPRNYSNFFELTKHLRGCVKYYPQSKEYFNPMINIIGKAKTAANLYYIQISDFNTTGMGYDANNRESAFYGFVRAAGVSNKSSDNAGGSFGFGKAAYFYISPIRSILVSTLTEEGKYYFEGVSTLCTHYDDNDEVCVSTGYYDNNGGFPISEEERIPVRFRRSEIGTDINIMGVDISDESDKNSIYDEMKRAVLQNFWLAIFHGKLDVEIGNLKITEYNVVDLINEVFPETHDKGRIKTKFNPRPYLEAVCLAESDKNHLLFEDTLPILGKVSFYVYKNKEAAARVVYLRSPRMMVECKTQGSVNGFYGVFFCEDRKGDKILRRIENPAHDQWHPGNWKDANGKNHSTGKEAFRELKEFINHCIELAFKRDEKEVLNVKGLDQYLYIPTAVEDDDDDLLSESLMSNPTGEFKEEGASITTDGERSAISDYEVSESIGKVLIDTIASTVQDDSGSYLSGNSGHRGKGRKGVGTGIINRRNTPVENDGIEGTYATEIPVRYRTFAQKINGVIYHNLILHSEVEVQNGRIDLLVGSDQQDDISVNIMSTSIGKISGNSISGLHIMQGKNKPIKIRFADELPHSIKLDAYEIK